MKRLTKSAEPTDILQRYSVVLESVTDSPLSRGNKGSLLIDGPATYAAMFEAITNAKAHINLETFILEDDEVGRNFTDLLLRKQAEGVQVHIIYDSVGSLKTPESFFKRLRDGGIQVFAENSIHLTNAYFIPDDQILDAFTTAARRGVDVQIILPSTTDSSIALNAARYNYSRLLKAGVKLYERRNAILHAKTAVIDGIWSTVGSTNLDYWSLMSDDEVNVIILNREFALETEKMFERDRAESSQITGESWNKRALLKKNKESFAHLFVHWL